VAFLRDFAVPGISALLDRTGEFAHRGQKRYDDTILLGYEATAESLDSPRGRAALRHLNRIHGRHDIPEHEYHYVLATTLSARSGGSTGTAGGRCTRMRSRRWCAPPPGSGS
jgi:hypothetical protein